MARNIGFIGCGRMAQALAGGFVNANITIPQRVILSDISTHALSLMKEKGFQTTSSNLEVIEKSDVVVLAVKPQSVLKIIHNEIQPHWQNTQSKLLISICAGIPLTTFQKALGHESRIARVMPNTPCLIGQAATCYSLSSSSNHHLHTMDDHSIEDHSIVQQLMSSVGVCYNLPDESLMDAVTALSGSGPAYIYTIIEAMSDAGVKAGLPRDVALGLSIQTVLGSANMLKHTGEHPAVLREQVTSPGGTTIAGLEALERHGIRAAVSSAVDAALKRSIEMGQQQQATPN